MVAGPRGKRKITAGGGGGGGGGLGVGGWGGGVLGLAVSWGLERVFCWVCGSTSGENSLREKNNTSDGDVHKLGLKEGHNMQTARPQSCRWGEGKRVKGDPSRIQKPVSLSYKNPQFPLMEPKSDFSRSVSC